MHRPRPVLVTGVPRSGTTWLARTLADFRRTSLPGREPMNPRGSQHGLGGTLTRWTRVTDPTPRQRAAVKTAFWGVNPRSFSRYGHHQWGALLPGQRVIIKDPFALLSLPMLTAQTHAQVVLVYRHPGAVLSSYRRMGWAPSLDELAASLSQDGWSSELREALGPGLSHAGQGDEVDQMAALWSTLHELALSDLPSDVIVVSHEEAAGGGERSRAQLLRALGMSDRQRATPQRQPSAPADGTDPQQLHRFDRAPTEVARSWRDSVDDSTVERLDRATSQVQARLHERRLLLVGSADRDE